MRRDWEGNKSWSLLRERNDNPLNDHLTLASPPRQAQQHMFNMPFQLSHPSIIESPDDADCADVSLVDVHPGDVIVMATDGGGGDGSSSQIPPRNHLTPLLAALPLSNTA